MCAFRYECAACLEICLEAETKSSEAVRECLELVMKHLRAFELISSQKMDHDLAEEGNSNSEMDLDKIGLVNRTQKEQKQAKALANQRKDKALLVGDSLVIHFGKNLQWQCVIFDTVCKPEMRIEQVLQETEKMVGMEDTVILCKSAQTTSKWMIQNK